MSWKLEPPVPKENMLFSGADLRKLMVPLMFEQLLLILVGVEDTAMVSRVGEAAVSGVSLVDMINQLIIQILSALATGGAVVSAQYIGRGDKRGACKTANQLFLVVLCIALGIMGVFLALRYPILRILFGNVDAAVMNSAMTYMLISALSYPLLALYSSGTALLRSMKKTNITLGVAAAMNVANLLFNSWFIFGLDMGVAGAALGSLVSRGVAAAACFVMLLNKKHLVHLEKLERPVFYFPMIRKILFIGIPNGIENGMFQLGKILVLSIISGFGTVQIAANAVANSLAGIEVIPGFAVGIGLITIVGQCVGAGDYKQAEYYTKKMTRFAYLILCLYNGGILLLLKPILGIYDLSPETLKLAMILLLIHGLFLMGIWTPAFVLPNALRAANDVRFTMIVSSASMWIFRVGFSFVIGKWLGLGAAGVWLAMILDWAVRAILFLFRFRSRKWQSIQLI